MAMTAFPELIIPPKLVGDYSYTTLDGQNERTGHCGQFTTPDGATRHITHICWSTELVTVGDDIVVQLETIDTATGLPNGVIGGASPISATQTVANGDDYTYFETALDNHYDLTSGAWLACTFKMTNASKNLRINRGYAYYATSSNLTWICEDITGGGVWVIGNNRANVALKCSTGEYLIPAGGTIFERGTYQNVNTGSTPRYVGNKIIVPNQMRLSGVIIPRLDLDYDITIKLTDASYAVFKADDTTTDMSVTLYALYRQSNGILAGTVIKFPCPKTLSANTSYYLVVSPDTASNVAIHRSQYQSEAIKKTDLGLPTGFTINHFTATTDWNAADHITETAEYISAVAPIFDQIYFPDAANVTEDDNTNGATGTYHEAAEAEVLDSVSFGAGSALTGTYHAPAASEVIHTAVFGVSSGTSGTYHAPEAAEVLDSASVGAGSGTYHAPDANEVWHTAVFGPASGTAGTKVASSIANCEAGNVKKDIVIDDVTGTYEGSGSGGVSGQRIRVGH